MTTELLCIGQDDGHDTIKTCLGFDKNTGKYLYGYHKSRAVEGLHQIMSFGNSKGAAYETEGRQFTVADGQALVRALDTRAINYPVSDLNRVLVNHALSECGLAGKPVYLITGLPVDQYYKDSKPNADLIEKKKSSLARAVTRVGAGQGMALIKKQGVVSEAIAAFYDALIQPDGSLDSQVEQLIQRRPVAVADLGGKTLDIAVVVENVAGVYGDRSGTENIGVLSVINKVAARIKAHFNLSNDPPPKYVEEAFRTKKYELFEEEKDVAEIVESACREYLQEVQNFFLSKVGDGSDLGAVMFVGGGAALIRAVLGDGAFAAVFKGKCIVPQDPEYANARGMWKYACFILTAEDRQWQDAASGDAEAATGTAPRGKKAAATVEA